MCGKLLGACNDDFRTELQTNVPAHEQDVNDSCQRNDLCTHPIGGADTLACLLPLLICRHNPGREQWRRCLGAWTLLEYELLALIDCPSCLSQDAAFTEG